MDSIEEIKNRIDIVELIGEYVKLQRVGHNWRGLCPFHHEKNPSFYVSPERQIWKCFGCNRGGNIFNFIMEIEGVTFAEALRILAKRAGVELKPIDKKRQSQKEIIFKINEIATSFFERNLWDEKGRGALGYLKKRGLSEKTIKEFHLGFALDNFSHLSDYLKQIGYKKEDIVASGLAIEKEKEGKKLFYDRFRSRIIFPFFDLSGRITGFSGRIFGQKIEGTGKYINTPQTLVFDKSRATYGFFQTKREIRNNDKILVVEGQMDLLSAWEKGLRFGVAISGTAFTSEQLKLLSRFSKNLFLCFDMDEAGQAADERIIPLALSADFNVKIIHLPFGKDLADFLAQAKEKEIEKIFKEASSAMNFYFQRALSLFDKNTLEGKKEIVKFFLPKVKSLPSPVEKGFWLEQLAKELQIKEDYLKDQLLQIKEEKGLKEFEEERREEEIFKTRKMILEEEILKIVLAEKSNQKRKPLLEEILCQKNFLSPKTKDAVLFLAKKTNFSKEKEEEINNFLGYLEMSLEIEKEKFKPEKELGPVLKEIEREFYLEKLNELSEEIKNLEEKKEEEKIPSLLKNFKRYSEKLKELK